MSSGWLRDSGIRAIGEVPWGTHLCLFYETRRDLIEMLVPYFAAGLAANESCIGAVSEPLDDASAEQALAEAIPGFEEHLAARDIEIVPGREFYLKGGRYDQ